MATKEKVMQLLSELFLSLLDENNTEHLQSGINDLFVRVDLERGEVALLGEEEEMLASSIIFSWIVPEATEPTKEMCEMLQTVVAQLERQGYWESTLFEQPFSVVLVDRMFAPIEGLLYLDDDTIQLSKPLLEGLNEDLDNFIHELLGDLK